MCRPCVGFVAYCRRQKTGRRMLVPAQTKENWSSSASSGTAHHRWRSTHRSMADEGKQVTAPFRRLEQLKRWDDSETNRESADPRPTSRKVKFQDGCVFLAACSSGDRDEVRKLLDRRADINTANVDGLTALHQACIDDNLDMVEFLVDEQADVNVCDNEGWTPLHATASCGFTEIARYLLKHGANVAAVNNDGDLAIDIAEDEEMENLLQEEMDKKDVDAEAARREEEDVMMADANHWLLNNQVEDNIHPKTGARALHVAAAKGYINVMNVLLQAGVDINSQDADGWTPLHAAVHWGQEDACHTLVDHLCDMDIKNQAGHTVFDLADSEMLAVLEELKKKQVKLRTVNDSSNDIIHIQGHGSRRRSSVTRMSSDQKHNVITKTVEEERATLDAKLAHLSSPKDEDQDSQTSLSTLSTQDAETERKNELNKQSSLISQPQPPRNRPPSLSSLDTHKPEMPKIDEGSEQDKPDSAANITISLSPTPSSTPSLSVGMDMSLETRSRKSTGSTEPVASTQENTFKPCTKDMVSRSVSAPATLPSDQSLATNRTSADELPVRSWRRGLRKIGSTSMVHEQMSENEEKDLPRSASSPRLVFDNNRIESLQERLNIRRPLSSTSALPSTSTTMTNSTDSRPGERSSWSGGQSSYTPYRDYLSRSGYKPFYQRQQELNQQKEQERASLSNTRNTRPASAISALSPTSPSDVFSSSPVPSTATSTTTAASVVTTTTTSTTSSTSSVFRRSYEPPKRDEETETQRKTRAKHARQTRRSTQGVSLEDIEKAEEVLRQGDSSKSSTTDSTKSSIRDSTQDVTTATTTTTTATSSLSSALTNDKDGISSLSNRESFRRRNLYDRQDEEPSTRTSFRRPREEKDSTTNGISSFSDLTSSYVPRSQRNALSTSDIGSSSPSLPRTASLRSRLRNGETESMTDNDTKKEETKESKEAESASTEAPPKKESAASRARRKRNERRPTGKVEYNPDDLEKMVHSEDGQTDESSENSRSGRYSSSDVPTDSSSRSTRPGSYSEYSRSTNSLDEYKKMYEEEKEENGKLKKELDQCKKDLLEAKAELDKIMKQRNDTSRNSDSSDKREKRALERKVSEYEEELKKMEALKADNQRLKDENGALIRVISKLSK